MFIFDVLYVFGKCLGFDTEKENNEDQPPDLAPKKKLTMNDRSYSHELSSSLPPKKSSSTVFGSVGSLTELSPSGKGSLIMPIFYL